MRFTLRRKRIMAQGETELQMVQRHVREGEANVRRQREIVTEMSGRGAQEAIAIDLLQQFLDVLRMHREHLARIQS
jgi:hypothetical protein